MIKLKNILKEASSKRPEPVTVLKGTYEIRKTPEGKWKNTTGNTKGTFTSVTDPEYKLYLDGKAMSRTFTKSGTFGGDSSEDLLRKLLKSKNLI